MTDKLVPGELYLAEAVGSTIFLVGKGELKQALEDQRLWWEHKRGRLFFCDQCSYFSNAAKDVQGHSELEHDCRFESYYTVDQFGASVVRVKTIKCHPRPSTGQSTRAHPVRRGSGAV